MEDYYEYLDSNGVTTLYKLIKDDTVALIDSYSVTINGITTNLDNHVNNVDIHTPIATIEGMIDTAVGSLNYATPDYVDTKVADLVNSSPETLDTLKELSDALGNDSNFATTVANQIGNKADKDDVYIKGETDTLLEGKANSVHTHIVSDITDFPTIPTKVSDLTNDSGYITSVSWEDVTDKPVLSQVAISGSYSDLSDTPIIPTKTSQLINDSGFLTSSNGLITSVSWSDITNKPNFATVATSGSYTDLSNTPTIPTKVSQLENDMGFGTGGDTSDCVHKTGDETIAGVKTFTASPFVSNYAVTNGYFTRLSQIARNEVPSQIYHSAFRVFDKNSKTLGEYCVEKSAYGSSLLHMDVHTEDSEGNDIMESLYLNLSNDGSSVRFYPAKDNRIDLGMPGNKWAKIYSDDVVHTSGNETIDGIKTFTSGPLVTNNGTTIGYSIKNTAIGRGEIPSEIYHNTFRVYDKNAKIMGEFCVEKSNSGSTLAQINVRSEDANGKQIARALYFNMSNDGTTTAFHPSVTNEFDLGMAYYKWANVYATKFIGNLQGNADTATSANDPNAVHKTGNETIEGTKKFTSDVVRKYTEVDIATTPTSDMYARINFTDKNDKSVAYIQYAQKSNGVDSIGLRVRDKNLNTWGVQLNTNKEFVPLGEESYSLGSANYKWAKVYSDDVVHTSGNETIAGIKTFTSGPCVTNKLTTAGYSIKNAYIARNEVPTQLYHATFRAYDKNDKILGEYCVEKSTSGESLLNMNVRSEDSSGTQIAHGLQFRMTNDGSVVRFIPTTNNKVHLGDVNAKWLKVHSDDVVHTTGNETISGVKTFSNDVRISKTSPFCNVFSSGYIKGQAPTSNIYSGVRFFDDINSGSANTITGGFEIEYNRDGYNKSYISSRNYAGEIHKFFTVGLRVPNDDTRSIDFLPSVNGIINLGTSTNKWKAVYATTFNGNLSGTIASSTTATTQATTDNSTKIATTAWVRNYVNSVGGSGNNTLGSSVSAYWSDSSNVTATGQSSSSINSVFPECYSAYVTKTPVVGTIYSGAQLYTVLNTYASAKGSIQAVMNKLVITTTAQATFSNPISATGKYLCTTANTVKFRAYTTPGSPVDVGTSSVVNKSSTKSIFIRVE